MARAYYNEIDAYAAAWLRNLISAGHIAPGDVDERSIVDVRPDDLKGYTQCHFFAGIGGWSYAARLAGWPDDRPLWTGSCPCQPFSSASRGRGGGTSSPAAALLPAVSVGKDHLRERIYFASHPHSDRKPVRAVDGEASRMQGPRGEPAGMGETHGVPTRVGKLRAYGNAIVPQVAAEVIGAYLDTELAA